jgi:hypothetical protein
MCLTEIAETYDPPVPEERTAYKLFLHPVNKLWLEFEYMAFRGSSTVPVNQWIKCHKVSVYTDPPIVTGATYDSGFHVLDTFEGAVIYRDFVGRGEIREVKIRGVRIKGTQKTSYLNNSRVTTLVADEMFVPFERTENE